MKCQNQTLNLLQFKFILLLFMCFLFYSSFVCISAYANVYFKKTILKQYLKIIILAGVPSSQALPGFLITAPASVCVPDVIGMLGVWISNPKKRKQSAKSNFDRQKAIKILILIDRTPPPPGGGFFFLCSLIKNRF